MFTVVFLGLLTGESQNIGCAVTQIAVRTSLAWCGKAAVWLINNINLDIDSLYPIMVIGMALLTYRRHAWGTVLAGYITGIIMGTAGW